MTTTTLTNNSTDFTTHFTKPLDFDENKMYEAALIHLYTYNSIPNITAKNNVFKYSTDKGKYWKKIALPPDAYEYKQIAEEIKLQMLRNKDYDFEKERYYIDFNICRLSSLIDIMHEDYQIDFSCENSIGSTLGFGNEIIRIGTHKSPKIVNITNINSILVNVDFISHSYLNEREYPTIYQFYPKVGPGYKIIERPNNLIYLPINRKQNLNNIHLWLTDQDRNPIDFQGEQLTVSIHIREKK